MKDDDKKDEIGIMLPFLSDDGGDDSEPDPNGGFVIRRMKPKTAADYASDEEFSSQLRLLRERRAECVLNACRHKGCGGFVAWTENEGRCGGDAEFFGACTTCNKLADATKYPLERFWTWYKKMTEDWLDDNGDEPDITRAYRKEASREEGAIQAWWKEHEADLSDWLAANPL